MGKVIGICNQKGGTGKTTTAVNLSAFLGLAGKKVLLIDMDPQANATSGVGVEKRNPNIYECLIENLDFREVITKTEFPNLWIIPANESLSGARVELIEVENREFRLKRITQTLKEDFDFLIIDAPPSLGILTINVLTCADSVLIPLQCEYYSLEGIGQLMNTINLVKKNLNPDLEIEGVIMTMADFRTTLTQEVILEVRKFFKEKVFKTIIPRNVKLAEAPSFGKPVYFYDKNSTGSKAYFKLTKELLNEEIEGVYNEEKIGQRVAGFNT